MKLTLLMTTKNRARYFKRALASMIREKNEGWESVEIVISDGGSSDETVEIIRANQNYIDKWVSEPDSGVSEGANRAYALATGDVVWAIGDDDVIVPGASRTMMNFLEKHSNVDVLFGQNTILKETAEGCITELDQWYPKTYGRVDKSTLLRQFHAELVVPETCFVRSKVLERVGGYSTDLHYYAFWDFFFRIDAAGFEMQAIDELVVVRHVTPVSDTLGAYSQRALRERDRVIEKYGGRRWLEWHRYSGKFPTLKDRVQATLLALTRYLGSTFGIHPRQWLKRVLRRST